MSRRLAAGMATLAIAAIAVSSAPAAVTPRIGTYVGHSPGAKRSTNTITIEVVERRGALRVRLLDLIDDCGSDFVITPIGLGKATGKFHDVYEGDTNSVGYRVVFDGRFIKRSRAVIDVQSSVGDLLPSGTAPGTANQCTDTTSFSLKFLPDGL
jgi:hypothetical protein